MRYWSKFQQSFKLFTKFGVAGQRILSNYAIPLTLFATAPSKFDLDRTSDGVQIPNQFIYARRPTSAEEIALPGFNLASIPLTECSNRELRDGLKIYNAALRIFNDKDTLCLDHLSKLIQITQNTKLSPSVQEALSSMVWQETRRWSGYLLPYL